jgi:hypothetical protein
MGGDWIKFNRVTGDWEPINEPICTGLKPEEEVFQVSSGNEFVTKDSGAKEQFPSGYQRDSREGKGRYDLLPIEGIAELARLFERGAAKYGESNWRKGAPLSRYCDSMLRHAFQATAGHEDECHFISVAWNALCAYATRVMVREGKLPAEIDDLPKTEPKP